MESIDESMDFQCREFSPGCIHDKSYIPFYVFCAEKLRAAGFTSDIDVTMGHILAGGIRVQDYVTTNVDMMCRDEKLDFKTAVGRVIRNHNGSFMGSFVEISFIC